MYRVRQSLVAWPVKSRLIYPPHVHVLLSTYLMVIAHSLHCELKICVSPISHQLGPFNCRNEPHTIPRVLVLEMSLTRQINVSALILPKGEHQNICWLSLLVYDKVLIFIELLHPSEVKLVKQNGAQIEPHPSMLSKYTQSN